jgi:uncharacterized membrane protein YhaH (DUF805 family)
MHGLAPEPVIEKGQPMSFSEAIKSVLSKYTDFSGRARRSEYWFWVLAVFVAWVIADIFLAISKPLGILVYLVIFFGTILPDLSVAIRRLHDIGRSGWWLLIGLIPFVGGIILLVFACIDSEPAPNAWGPSPKAAATGY